MNLAARQVFLGSEPVEISWRQFEALRLLIEAGGRPVEREKLLEALWPGVTVEEASLNQCISQLRKVLNDTPETGIILTVPRLGYRLGAFMSPDELQPGVAVEPVANAEGSRGGNWRARRWAAVALLLALLAGGGWVGRRALRTARAEALASEGIALVRQNQQPKVAAGNELLRQAMDLSPNLAIAYAGLAEGMVRSGESLPGQAKGMALRSVQLAPDCGACLATAGWVLMSREWQWEEALDYLSRAARFTPDDGRIRLWHAQILAVNGNLDAALREADRAIELQPGEVAAITMRAGILYLQQRYEEAIFSARKALAIQPTHTSAMVWLYRAYGRQRRFAEALSLLSSAGRHFTGMSADQEYSLTAQWDDLLETQGIEGWVRKQLAAESGRPIQDMMRYEHATWRLWIGDRNGALRELEGLFSVRPYDSMYLAADPAFTELRGDPRFQNVVQRMGLQRSR